MEVPFRSKEIPRKQPVEPSKSSEIVFLSSNPRKRTLKECVEEIYQRWDDWAISAFIVQGENINTS